MQGNQTSEAFYGRGSTCHPVIQEFLKMRLIVPAEQSGCSSDSRMASQNNAETRAVLREPQQKAKSASRLQREHDLVFVFFVCCFLLSKEGRLVSVTETHGPDKGCSVCTWSDAQEVGTDRRCLSAEPHRDVTLPHIFISFEKQTHIKDNVDLSNTHLMVLLAAMLGAFCFV